MAIRYTPDDLKKLRESPLVLKPATLPPAEQWMGPPADPARNSARLPSDRNKSNDSNTLLDQTNRRPALEHHMSRNSATNPEDIILGPPKTSFLSATSLRNAGKFSDSTDRTTFRDLDSRDRYNLRGKGGDGDVDRSRELRSNGRSKYVEGEQDSDGWSTVKPRKSFGTEGAERFNGRMGVDRHRDDRRMREREDREPRDKQRGFDTYSRDKDGEHDDSRRNGTGRGRSESWFKDRDNNHQEMPLTPRDRNSNGDRYVDRNRGWREKDRDDQGERFDRGNKGDRGGDRADRGDRRWDRDRDPRQEREPEWMDAPVEEKIQTHTQEEFQRWKAEMQVKDNHGKSAVDDAPPDAGASFFGLEKQKVETPLEIEAGPDKFFGMWAAPKEEPVVDADIEVMKEVVPKAKTVGKASRFTSFFTPQEEPPRRQTEPPPAVPVTPTGGLDTLLSNQNSTQSVAEKEAFQQLLQKLQRQTFSGPGSAPPANVSLQPKPPGPERATSNSGASIDMFQQYRTERPEEGRPKTRGSQQALQELLNQRQVAGSQPTVRPEQILQDLVGQRQTALSQASMRSDQLPSRNQNTEFLMGLMQSAKAAPEPQRTEQLLLRLPPKTVDRHMQQMMDREQDLQREIAAQRERSASQRQTRAQPPPGFFDETAFHRGPPPQHERPVGNPPQPTQILQRPAPPGLDLGWDRQAQLPPQHRGAQSIAPPPGLANGPTRGMPMPQGMFPPGFPMQNYPPPDIMNGPPRNMQMQPPPGFFSAPPPPGFLPPGMTGFQGPEVLGFGVPFDGRGPPPQGAFRRQ